MIATTLLRIARPVLAVLQEEVRQTRKTYQHSWVLLGEAWDMYNEAVDSGASNEVKNLLANSADAAEENKSAAWTDMNNAEALLLSVWN